ncbi:16171_t:CDS:2, partial [Dentiscutata erythropus]
RKDEEEISSDSMEHPEHPRHKPFLNSFGETYYSLKNAMQLIDLMQDTRIIWNQIQEQWTPFWLKRPCVLLRDFSRLHRLPDPIYSLKIE